MGLYGPTYYGYWPLNGSPISCEKAEDFLILHSTGGPGISSWHCFARLFVLWRRRFLGGGFGTESEDSPYLSGTFHRKTNGVLDFLGPKLLQFLAAFTWKICQTLKAWRPGKVQSSHFLFDVGRSQQSVLAHQVWRFVSLLGNGW